MITPYTRAIKFSSYFIAISILTFLFSLLYWVLYNQPLIGIDDANIYFIYIRNLVEQGDFIYNHNGEKVEGFTSMLWVLLLTPIYYFFTDFELSTYIIGYLLTTTTIFFTIYTLDHVLFQNKNFITIRSLLFLSLIFLIPGFIEWTTLTLMESSLWTLLNTSIVVCLIWNIYYEKKNHTLLSILLSFLVLTRPESLLLGLVYLFLIFITSYVKHQHFIGSVKIIIIPSAAFFGTILILTIFRIEYFNYPLPNTYYAKVSHDRLSNTVEGIVYLIKCTFQSPLLWLIIITTIYSSIRILNKVVRKEGINNNEIAQIVLTTTSIFGLIIPIYVGGDHFKMGRFLQPFMPIFYLQIFNSNLVRELGTLINKQLIPTYINRIILLSTLIPFISLLSLTPIHTFIKNESPLQPEFNLASLGREEGREMNTFFQYLDTLPSVGISAAGGFGYSYNGYIVDLMGLNNTEMAHAQEIKTGIKNHAAFDPDTFLRLKPDIFHGYRKISYFTEEKEDITLLENTVDFEEKYVSEMYKNIFRELRFINQYKPVIISRDNKIFKTYISNDFVTLLKTKGYSVTILNRTANKN